MSDQELHELAEKAKQMMGRLCEAGMAATDAADVMALWIERQIKLAEAAAHQGV